MFFCRKKSSVFFDFLKLLFIKEETRSDAENCLYGLDMGLCHKSSSLQFDWGMPQIFPLFYIVNTPSFSMIRHLLIFKK
jgi:hypothetical protein